MRPALFPVRCPPLRVLCLPAALLSLAASPAPMEAGRWLTQDRSSVIEIGPCGTELCGRIVGISLDHPTDPSPRDIWGGLQCNESIIRMAPPRAPGGSWHGTILDPRSGRRWSAQIWWSAQGLHLRGYLGLPIFGATQIWTSYVGHTRPNCDFDHGPDRGGSPP